MKTYLLICFFIVFTWKRPKNRELKTFNVLIWQIFIFVCYWWIIIMIEFEKSPKVARLAAANDKVYLLLAHGRWFSLGTPFSSTTKTSRHDIAEILSKVALNIKNQINHQKELNFADFTWYVEGIYKCYISSNVAALQFRRSTRMKTCQWKKNIYTIMMENV